MLTEKEAKDKLLEYAGMFRHHVRRREWKNARYCYDTAINVSVFMSMEQDFMDRLFGVRGEKGAIIKRGEFPDGMVLMCMEKTMGNKEKRS